MKHITIAAVILGISMMARGQEFDQMKLAKVPEKMKELVAADEISGAVTCIATRDKIVQLEAVGLADVKNNTPMKTDDLFWIASMTKPITGASIMMLQEQGKLSFDDPVSKYIPEFANIKTPSGKPANLTIKHLMTHTSGVAEVSGPEGHTVKNLAALIPLFVDKPTQFEPGTEWRYCQTGINSLGRIIEIVSGESYPDFVQHHLLEPLGMKDTTFYPTADQMKRLAKSYKKDPATGKLVVSEISMLSGIDFTSHDRIALANGGLFSTAPDYARFMQMLMNGGTLDGKTYLKRESVKLMTTSQTGDLKAGFVPARHGWGCCTCIVLESKEITSMLSPGTFGHGGAYGTQAWADPVKGVAYILMIQRADVGNSDNSPMRMAFQQAAAGAVK
jgi:CubicO group peptidase (beta-lactamase class C family)